MNRKSNTKSLTLPRPTLRRHTRSCPLALLTLLTAACAPRPASSPTPAPSRIAAALTGADTLRSREVAPGIHHTYAWDARGPWAINVLEVDRTQCGNAFEARKPGPPLTERSVTSALAADAHGGVNADFFAIPAGTPTNAHVTGSAVLIGPGSRPLFAVSARGPWIRRGALDGTVSRSGSDESRPHRDMTIVQVNRPARDADTTGLVLFTHWFGPASHADSAAVAVAVAVSHGNATAGRGVVATRDTLGGALSLDSTIVVLTGRGAAGYWLRDLEAGDTLQWSVAVVPQDPTAGDATDAAREAVGGRPVLLRDGRVAAATETAMSTAFGRQRHPRTAIGIADDGRRVLLVTVDGRQEPYSAGMTLAELADLLRRLGAEDALNLDGGGSTTMVVQGQVVNRPSDREGERPVGNALVVHGGSCSR